MKIKAVNKDLFVGSIGELGRKLIKDVVVEVDDDVAYEKTFASLVDSGDIAIISFGKGTSSIVSQSEFNDIAQGLYKSTGVKSGATITGPFVASTITGTVESVFPFDKKYYLNILVDSTYTINIAIEKATYSTTTLVNYLNGIVDFSTHLVATDDANKIKITTRSFGTSSKIKVLDNVTSNAKDIIGLSVIEQVGSGDPEQIQVAVKSPVGFGMSKANVVIGIYDNAVGGSLVGTSLVQVLTKGNIVSFYANEVILKSDYNGDLEFELIDSGATGNRYVDISAPAGYFLANTPASRLQIPVA